MFLLVGLFMKWGLGQKAAEWVAHMVLFALLILAVVLSYVYAYEHGRGVEKAIWVAKINEYEAKLKTNAEIYDLKESGMKEVFKTQMDKAKEDYKTLEQQKQQTITVVKRDMVKYVTPETDKRSVDCNVFTAGWLYQYNRAFGAQGAGLSGSPGGVPATTTHVGSIEVTPTPP